MACSAQDLEGVTVDFAMQGNNVGTVVGPVVAGIVAASLGWFSAALLVCVVSLAMAGFSAQVFPHARS